MGLPENIFDPRHYAGARQDVRDATTLPPWCYASESFYRREIERIFMKTWCFVGHAGRIPKTGDFACIDYAGAKLILLRDRDGRPRAYANSCRHRGMALLEGEGHCRAIKCGYHGWTFGLDGALVAAPEMSATPGFDAQDWGLKEVRLETFRNLMFVDFSGTAPPLVRHIGDLAEKLAPYDLENQVLVRRTEYDVACNWKVYVENFMDYYHTPTVHRTSLASGDLSVYHRNPPTVERGTGEYMSLYAKHKGTAALLVGATGFPPMPSLSRRAVEGSTFACVFPCALLANTKDCVWHVEIHPRGPDRIRLAVGACFHPETVARPDFQEIVGRYYQRWDVSVKEDNDVNELQQRGVSSPLAEAGRVSPMEALSHTHRNWVLDRVIGR
ncbi:MAG: aromatic ring-hydroxylating dioxygenase subunit alpha [Alphaproteobacteria bacterium]|nr:aromatic ring-hydroxylating dioxygenase subunit alpha [Alphaproteobacteria bacterium]